MERPFGTLRAWHADGTGLLALRTAGIGAVAGLASWILVYALQSLFGDSGPTLHALILAVPRGAFFGALLGLALGAYLNRRVGRRRRP